jgi:hypothetical protein
MSQDKASLSPIWHSPGWITAIVGLVGSFLTVPDRIGSYLTQSQQIEGAKQQQELELVTKTMEQVGPERIFILRYIAATNDDMKAVEWATAEVSNLDKVSDKQLEVEQDVLKLSALNGDELVKARSDLASKSAELSKLEKLAGLTSSESTGESRVEQMSRLQTEGISAVLERDYDAALLSYNLAYKLWPVFRNVDEIRSGLRRLGKNGEPSDEAWREFENSIRRLDLRGVPSNLVSRLGRD